MANRLITTVWTVVCHGHKRTLRPGQSWRCPVCGHLYKAKR